MPDFNWGKSKKPDCILNDLWCKGKTGSQIAIVMNRTYDTAFSRSAILGRINKLGLSRADHAGNNEKIDRMHAGDATTAKKPRRQKVAPRNGKLKLGPKKPASLAVSGDASRCTFIFGEPAGRDFCKANAIINLRGGTGYRSWCQEHFDKVYQPGLKSKRAA